MKWKKPRKIVERGKIDTPDTHIHYKVKLVKD